MRSVKIPKLKLSRKLKYEFVSSVTTDKLLIHIRPASKSLGNISFITLSKTFLKVSHQNTINKILVGEKWCYTMNEYKRS